MSEEERFQLEDYIGINYAGMIPDDVIYNISLEVQAANPSDPYALADDKAQAYMLAHE